ncbi:hypothetical protein [Streptomyces antarcticus]|uniref:hypothetical protein n=1 Tax=Streptomyces antarcticus TaxID=2996458 RepID=UPI002271151D|nr:MULTISPECIES: hypothetical protein [unclassified Streptomyces]MCY0942369.1 hypothetical protein [Streptomyces sp. H34-AA3]MCZ4080634.1 hypothetical protein [Streptomyces sp. H34-S5]
MPPSKPPKVLTDLDHRVEAVTGHTIDRLWKHQDRGLLDEPLHRLAEAHRSLADAETGVTFYRVLLERLASGELAVDQALFVRIDRTVGQLKDATAIRDACQEVMVAALEPLEAAKPRVAATGADLLASEFAALLAISQGAKLHQHLQTGRLSVVTGANVRVPHPVLQRLEEAELVVRDTSHPLHAGQPVSLTDSGRTTLTGPARLAAAVVPPPRVGSWPAPPARSR